MRTGINALRGIELSLRLPPNRFGFGNYRHIAATIPSPHVASASSPLRLFRAMPPTRPLVIWTLTCLLLLPAMYWNYTGHVWEDFLITYRHSENFVAGLGLTYQPGTRLHGFTSPLNVLVPTAFAVLTEAPTYALPLLLTNVVTLACLAVGGLILLRTLAPHTSPSRQWTLWLLPLFLALNIKLTAYTVNGQEAGYWALFLALSFAALVRGASQHWLLGGIGWAGLMWSRPDSPVHIVMLAALALIFPAGNRKEEAQGLLKAAFVCTLCYLPWFVGAWIYYGTPVPHTILAKSGAYHPVPLSELSLPNLMRRLLRWFGEPYLPIYSYTSGWPLPLLVAGGVAGLASVASLISRDRITRLAAGCFFCVRRLSGFCRPAGDGLPVVFYSPGCIRCGAGSAVAGVNQGSDAALNLAARLCESAALADLGLHVCRLDASDRSPATHRRTWCAARCRALVASTRAAGGPGVFGTHWLHRLF